MTNYCTLDDAKKELKAKSAVNATEEPKLRNYIRTVSSRIDEIMGTPRRPYFAPYTEQRKYKISPSRIDSYDNVFWLDNYPILSVTNVLRGTTDVTSVVEIYTDREEVDRGLRLTDNCSIWYSYEYPPVFVKVTGIWGWHEDYTNAFDKVDDVLDAAGINASVTSITVLNADGADLEGYTPRFSPGNLIKIGSELMDVTAVNTTSNVLTVRRARNGTTAAAHLVNADIEVYQVDIRIRRIAIRQTDMLYSRMGAFQVETLDGVGVITYPQDMLAELRATLQGFQYA